MTKSKNKSKALAVAEETALEAYDYGEDAGAGDEDQTIDDHAIPFLVILQKNSPQCDEDHEKFIEGAKPGQIYNTVTDALYDELTGVVALTKQAFMEWVPRTKGGGLRGSHDPKSPVVVDAKKNSADFGKYYTKEGNDLVETFYLFLTMADGPDAGSGAMLACTSTKIQPYKKWNSKRGAFKLPNGQKPPIFAHAVKLTTVKQSNEHGTYFNIMLKPANGDVCDSLLAPGDPVLEAAKAFRAMIKAGEANIDYEGEQKASGGESDGDIPF